MMASSDTLDADVVNGERIDDSGLGISGVGGPRNPLICGLCHDYYSDPCLLMCYHTFCARCLLEPRIGGKLSCPICGQITQLKDEAQKPPSDHLMRQLVEFANTENPPCANCDKRDKTTMFFCTTCGQALCTHCREHTHRAKMFSSHDVVHMSKCNKDTQRRCPHHGEQYIMFSQSTKQMLCATCFRETPPDARLHCMDIETAWQMVSKKMERAVNSICELQANVHDGLLDLKSQLNDLKCNLEEEQRALNIYYQGIQEAVSKAHSAILAELHREFDTKDRIVRTHLLALGSALPVLQMHLGLCTAFTSAASKHQFLELAHPMLERLSRVAQLGHLPCPPFLSNIFKIDYRSEFIRALEPFMNTPAQVQITKDVFYDQYNQQHQLDSQFLQQNKTNQKAQTKGLLESGRFNSHCRTFDNQLQELNNQLKTVKERLGELHKDVALLRRANTPPLITRYENVTRDCRLLDQQLEYQQKELERLKAVFDALWEEQLCRIHLEKEVFHSQMNDILSLKGEVKQLQLIAHQFEPFIKSFTSGVNTGEATVAASDANTHQHLQVLLDHLARLQMQEPVHSSPTKECRQLQSQQQQSHLQLRSSHTAMDNSLYSKETKEMVDHCRTPSSGGVQTVLDASGNIVVYGTKTEPRKGVLSQLIEKAKTKEDRRKLPGHNEGYERNQNRRSRKSPENLKPKSIQGCNSTNKVRSLYRSLKGGSVDVTSTEIFFEQQQQQGEESEYQRISEASSMGEAKRVQAQIHSIPSETGLTFATIKSARLSKSQKVYPASDSEELFYGIEKSSERVTELPRRRASCDSLSTAGSESRRSSIVDTASSTIGSKRLAVSSKDARKTLVLFIGPSGGTPLVKKQRSWETFPRPKNKRTISMGEVTESLGLGQLKKADSFEGHEEAVRTLVAAVQENRSQIRQAHLNQHRVHRKSKTN